MNSFGQTLKDPKKLILFLWQCSIVVCIITFFILYSKIHFANNIIVLHYNVIVGSDYIGKATQLYLIPVVGVFFIFINFALAKFIGTNNILISYLAPAVSLAVNFILFAASAFILLIN